MNAGSKPGLAKPPATASLPLGQPAVVVPKSREAIVVLLDAVLIPAAAIAPTRANVAPSGQYADSKPSW